MSTIHWNLMEKLGSEKTSGNRRMGYWGHVKLDSDPVVSSGIDFPPDNDKPKISTDYGYSGENPELRGKKAYEKGEKAYEKLEKGYCNMVGISPPGEAKYDNKPKIDPILNVDLKILSKTAVNDDAAKEAIISSALSTEEGRTALAQAMVAPIRTQLEYQAGGRKLFMADELPMGALKKYERDVASLANVIGRRGAIPNEVNDSGDSFTYGDNAPQSKPWEDSLNSDVAAAIAKARGYAGVSGYSGYSGVSGCTAEFANKTWEVKEVRGFVGYTGFLGESGQKIQINDVPKIHNEAMQHQAKKVKEGDEKALTFTYLGKCGGYDKDVIVAHRTENQKNDKPHIHNPAEIEIMDMQEALASIPVDPNMTIGGDPIQSHEYKKLVDPKYSYNVAKTTYDIRHNPKKKVKKRVG